MLRRLTLAIVFCLLLAVASASTTAAQPEAFTMTPLHDTGRVGTTHTVVATLTQEIPGVEFHFEVVSGPNTGASSDFGGCVPSDCYAGFNESTTHSVAWTYVGSGGPGTDVIEVCLGEVVTEFVQTLNDNIEGQCQDVTMTWFQAQTGFPGAILPAAAQSAAKNIARANAPAAAPAVSPPSTGTGTAVSPPNTGDAGLKRSAGPDVHWAALAAAVLALAGVTGLMSARR